MINLFKSDLFLMRKMKVAYIMPAIFLVAAIFFGVFLIRFNMDALLKASGASDSYSEAVTQANVPEDQSFGENYVNSFYIGLDAGMDSTTEERQDLEPEEDIKFFSGGIYFESTVADFFALMTGTSLPLILTGLFAAFLFAIDIRGGFRKNITMINPNRWMSFTSKVLTVLVYDILFLIFEYVTCIIMMALMAKSLDFGFSADFFLLVALRLLLSFAFCMLIALITCLSKSTAIGMVADILFGSGMLALGFYFLNLLIKFLATKININIPDSFSLDNYTITGCSSQVSLNMSDKLILRVVVVCVSFIIVSYACAGYLNQKRDIH